MGFIILSQLLYFSLFDLSESSSIIFILTILDIPRRLEKYAW